jgi:hypothetical protein
MRAASLPLWQLAGRQRALSEQLEAVSKRQVGVWQRVKLPPASAAAVVSYWLHYLRRQAARSPGQGRLPQMH